jgi:hypothetical protein
VSTLQILTVRPSSPVLPVSPCNHTHARTHGARAIDNHSQTSSASSRFNQMQLGLQPRSPCHWCASASTKRPVPQAPSAMLTIATCIICSGGRYSTPVALLPASTTTRQVSSKAHCKQADATADFCGTQRGNDCALFFLEQRRLRRDLTVTVTHLVAGISLVALLAGDSLVPVGSPRPL